MQTHPLLASFDTTLSPHRRITAPSLCAAFAHISWRGGNISFGHLECQGGSDRPGSLCRRRGGFHMQTHPPFSPLSTPPCLRTGESLHLVCARPSPTSMARREHQLWASGVPGWVRSARFSVQEEGWISYANAPPFSPLSTPPCLRTGESLHLVCARPSPTSMARREHQLWASGVPGWVRTVRFSVQEEGWISYANAPPLLAPFDTTLSPHRRITAASLCAAFAHIHGEAGTSALGIWSARVGLRSVRFSVQEEGWISYANAPPFSHPFRHCPVSAQANHCS
jgi:hypothetical protein